MRVVSGAVLLVGVCALSCGEAAAQDATCKPLYDAVRKAHEQAGVERTATIGDPARPDMTMTARKTASGWYQRMGTAAWRAMPIDPDIAERKMLDSGNAFVTCVSGATEAVNGESARVWNYVTTGIPSQMWISVSRGLPLKVQAPKALQVSTYQTTPYPKP